LLVSASSYRLLPTYSGVYLFLDKKNNVIYVGKAKNLKKRVSSYFSTKDLGEKIRILVSQIEKIKYQEVSSEIDAFLLEEKLIKKYKPKYNIKLIDDKAYPMVKITIKDDYPKVLIVRRRNDKNSIYFGPFPNAALALRTVLKTIRRIFPYQSVLNHDKKICLYNHLGLCPCPPVFAGIEFQKEYKANVRHIIDFLNGNTKKIIQDLENERDILSQNEKFEKAELTQNKIKAIELITGPFYKTKFDPEINPNLTDDLREKELTELANVLQKNNIPIKNPDRIECFDISNISGTNSVGSMVTFINGEKDSDWYRKFKVRSLNTPNDFAMMEEVLSRRLKHPEWPFPDLLIVDGGKGQVSTAVKVMQNLKLNIPIIGLAKREETIVTSNLQEISLNKNAPALKLLMRIRDEAHRFAITYHRKLRSKTFLSK